MSENSDSTYAKLGNLKINISTKSHVIRKYRKVIAVLDRQTGRIENYYGPTVYKKVIKSQREQNSK